MIKEKIKLKSIAHIKISITFAPVIETITVTKTKMLVP